MSEEIKKMLGEILESVKALDVRISRIEGGQGKAATPALASVTDQPGKKLSIKEFVIACAPKNGVQMTLAIAYYLETHEKVSPFNAADLERGFRAAKETVPTNINDKVNMSVKNGHIMEEKEKKDAMKAWVVTRTGEQFVQNGFDKSKV